ncbi:MAG: ABC transporter permease [Dehalococcoidia bacterium]
MASQPEIAAERLRRFSGFGWSFLGGTLRWLWWFSKRKPLGAIGLFILTFAGIVAVFGPLLAPMDPLEIHARSLFHGPQWVSGFVLGTDNLGRDNMSRLIIGTRSSLSIAVIAVTSGTIFGYGLGLYSGFYPDWRDALIMRLVDVLMALPIIVLALAIVAVLGQSTRNVIIAIALIQVPGTARIVRSVVISIRTMEYVQAARALGATDRRILLRHVAPQTFAPVMILVTAALGLAIIIEASLSFLGLGTPPPNPAWGAMLAGQAQQNFERAPWNAIFPGLALSLTVFGFNLLGDALRDVLDPRLRI